MKRELELENCEEDKKSKRVDNKLTALPVDRTALVALENWQTSTLHECFISQVDLAVELATMRIISDCGVIKVFMTKTLVTGTRDGDELFSFTVLVLAGKARRQRLFLFFIFKKESFIGFKLRGNSTYRKRSKSSSIRSSRRTH